MTEASARPLFKGSWIKFVVHKLLDGVLGHALGATALLRNPSRIEKDP